MSEFVESVIYAPNVSPAPTKRENAQSSLVQTGCRISKRTVDMPSSTSEALGTCQFFVAIIIMCGKCLKKCYIIYGNLD